MKKIKEFISAFIKFIKSLTPPELAFIIFFICMIILIVIGIIGFVGTHERKYIIRDVSGRTYYVDEYVKESDGTIKIERDGNTYILNGYTIKILNDKKGNN